MDHEHEGLYLGAPLDPADGSRMDEPLAVEARSLTTHGVIVGMTGSGKTGLGVILLEEALLSGIPVLAIDPKGDIGNLALTFPDLAPADFEPWVDPAEARREGIGTAELATRTARSWKEGLASWGIGPERIRTLRERAAVTIYTPGSGAGTPLNLIGSLDAPDLDWGAHGETLRDEIEGLVTGLLTLAGRGADPVSDPEHILLANIVEHVWRGGRDLDLPGLIGLVLDPPMRKLGVFPIDDFMGEGERRTLAMQLNALVASPSFASWLEGAPLDVPSLLRDRAGRPRAAVVHLAHLSDTERQFVVTLLLTRLVTWMRQQPGTSDLRALVYMDEMFGFAPPTANPPSKKPILTIFKQARAHGVGMVVATQNPVDLDYKTFSNAGTWMVGRLQTERDKARVLEGLRSAAGGGGADETDAAVSGLGKRQFVLRTARSPETTLFTTRWAMSYLRGALTREELVRLRESGATDTPEPQERSEPGTPPASPAPAPAGDETPVAPAVPASVPVYWLDPAAPWAGEVGARPGSPRMEAALAVRVALRFDERVAELDHEEEWEAVFFPLEARFDPSSGLQVDHDPRDFRSTPPEGVRYALPDAPVTEASFFRDAERALRDHLHRDETLRLLRNPELGLHSRVGESEEAFRLRCRNAAADLADEKMAALRDRYADRIDRVRDRLEAAERRVRELEVDVEQRRQQELVSGAGRLVSMFLKGRADSRSLSGFSSRRSTTRRTEERLRSAADRAAGREDEIAELEREMAEEMRAIVEEAEAAAGRIDSLEVGLEKDDIHVREVALLWIPRPAGG